MSDEFDYPEDETIDRVDKLIKAVRELRQAIYGLAKLASLNASKVNAMDIIEKKTVYKNLEKK